MDNVSRDGNTKKNQKEMLVIKNGVREMKTAFKVEQSRCKTMTEQARTYYPRTVGQLQRCNKHNEDTKTKRERNRNNISSNND